MVSFIEAAKTGVGIYSPREVARYAKMHPNTINGWFFAQNKRFRSPQIDENERLLGFYDLMEAIAVRSFRVHHNVSLKKIRDGADQARKLFKTNYPFADVRHRAFSVNGDLYISHEDNPESAIQIAGKSVGQCEATRLIEPWISDVKSGDDGLIISYSPSERIVLNPNFRFGAPLVGNTGYTAEALWQAATAEGSYEAAAEEYGVDVDDIRAAVRYCDGLEAA